jgi:hypothetical protein
MIKTNNGLVANVSRALNDKWGYVYGTFGNVLTPKRLEEKCSQYPDNVNKYKDFILKNYLGKRTADCVGLIKAYLWLNEDAEIVYNKETDVSADEMFARSTKNGIISSIPETAGVCVWKKGHIGVYIGDNKVIEAHGTKFGVIETPLIGQGSTPWTHWLECPFIDYLEDTEKAKNSWKLESIDWLYDYDLITEREQWEEKADFPAPVWFVASLIQRLYNKLKGANK